MKEGDNVKRILVVDDEEDMVWSLSKSLRKDMQVEVITSMSATGALELMRTAPVDLLITDINMPGLNGMDLLLKVKELYPETGVIIMTAYPTPEFKRDALNRGCLNFIEKPFDVNYLREKVRLALSSDKGFRGTIAGIELSDVLQINCMSRNTAALRVKTLDREGMIFFKDGRMVHAMYGNIEGEEAFYTILTFEGGTIESLKGVDAPVISINRSCEALLMEGFRMIDEHRREADGPIRAGTVIDCEPLNAGGICPNQPAYEELRLDDEAKPSEEEKKMALEHYLQGLKEIKGYKASGIMNFTGEMLASDSEDKNIDLAIVGATFNDIFRSAHEASKKIGLDACKETVIATPKGVVVMRCSGIDAKSHVHFIGILSSDGNQALMKMQMEKMVPPVMDELS